MSRKTNTASGSSPSASKRVRSKKLPSSPISDYSSVRGTPAAIAAWLTSFQRDSPASPFHSQVAAREQAMSEICGLPPWSASARWDQDSASWKTCQGWLYLDILAPSWETWPKQGLIVDGAFYRQPNWEPRISATGSGLWPTPRAGKTSDEKEESWLKRRADGKVATPPLSLAVKMFPTPSAQDAHNNGSESQRRRKTAPLNAQVLQTFPTPTADDANNASANRSGQYQSLTRSAGGKLNADWVDWLMGMPVGWSAAVPLRAGAYAEWLARTQIGFVVQPSLCTPPSSHPQAGSRPAAAEHGAGDDTKGSFGPGGGWWDEEPAIPRTNAGGVERVNRLTALGNAQVPAVAAVAWLLLTDGLFRG